MPSAEAMGGLSLSRLELPEGIRGRWLATGLTFCGLALIWSGVVLPLVGAYADGARALEARQLLQQRMVERAQTLADLQHELAVRSRSGAAARAELLSAPSDTMAAVALQEMVQSLATRVGASLGSVETLEARPVGAYREIGLHVSLIARWPVLIRLLQDVEDAVPRLMIEDLRLHNALPDAADPPMNAVFTVRAFRAGGEAVAP